MQMIAQALLLFSIQGHRPEMALWTEIAIQRGLKCRMWHAELRCDGDSEPVRPLNWNETLFGNGGTPTEAIADLEVRASRYVSANSR